MTAGSGSVSALFSSRRSVFGRSLRWDKYRIVKVASIDVDGLQWPRHAFNEDARAWQWALMYSLLPFSEQSL